jgi:hypothetical protein
MIIGTPHKHNAGYFCNDIETSRRQEDHVQTCTHCQRVILMSKWKDDGAFCGKCMAPICGPCGDRMLTRGCEPFIKQLEAAVNMRYKLDQFCKMAGLDERPRGYTPAIIVGGK